VAFIQKGNAWVKQNFRKFRSTAPFRNLFQFLIKQNFITFPKSHFSRYIPPPPVLNYSLNQATQKPDFDGQGIAGRLGDTDSGMASGRLSIAVQIRLQILVRSHYSHQNFIRKHLLHHNNNNNSYLGQGGLASQPHIFLKKKKISLFFLYIFFKFYPSNFFILFYFFQFGLVQCCPSAAGKTCKPMQAASGTWILFS
jgi:hypothetical protein